MLPLKCQGRLSGADVGEIQNLDAALAADLLQGIVQGLAAEVQPALRATRLRGGDVQRTDRGDRGHSSESSQLHGCSPGSRRADIRFLVSGRHQKKLEREGAERPSSAVYCGKRHLASTGKSCGMSN